jgi:two-component system response regulator LytT
MKIVIVEDEVKAARSLAGMISSITPEAEIVASLQSVQSAIDYFSHNASPALIFMDIQLADGLCFEIFKETAIRAPVIFCTAYDEYAIEGFKANGIDYILKPFTEEKLTAALNKVRSLKTFFQSDQLQLQSLTLNGGKKSFLVFKHNKYSIIAVDNIACFHTKNEVSTLHTFDGEEYFINQSLDVVSTMLAPGQFYRVTRQYLINFSAVGEVEHYFSRKLLIHLKVNIPDQIIINKNNTTAFLNWLDNR